VHVRACARVCVLQVFVAVTCAVFVFGYIRCSILVWEPAIPSHFHVFSQSSETEAEEYLDRVSASSYKILMFNSALYNCCSWNGVVK
jgi:hypothetical protein